MKSEKDVIDTPLVRFVKKWAKETESEMKMRLSKKGKSDTDIYKKLKLVVKPKGSGVEVTNNLPDYAIFVDKGRRPGKQPPLKNIREWCRRKGINQDAAFPIARAIGKRGIKATNFMEPYRDFKRLILGLQETVADAITDDIKDVANETIVDTSKKQIKI